MAEVRVRRKASPLTATMTALMNGGAHGQDGADTNAYRDVGTGQPAWNGASMTACLGNGFIAPDTAPEQGYAPC